MTDIQLYNDDCIKAMSKMPDKSVDMVIADIPYGECSRFSNGLRNLDYGKADVVTFPLNDFLKEMYRLTKGSVYVFCGTEQVSGIRSFLVKSKLSTRLCIWEKTNPSPMNGNKIWLSGVECCVYGKFPKATFNEHCKNTVFRYPVVHKKIHPTQKPVALLEEFIKASSNLGDIILDPCMGSGSTGVACVNTHRGFIGIELDKTYFDIASKRIKAKTDEPDTSTLF